MAKGSRATIKALKEQIKAVERAINEKMKKGDMRGANSMMKKLTKLKRQLKSYRYK